jgi:hypothetical protein
MSEVPSALSITFNGPLFFIFHKGSDTTVDVYAPYCPYHEAGIFYSDNSFSETNLWQCSRRQPSVGLLDRAYSIYGAGLVANSEAPILLQRKFPQFNSSAEAANFSPIVTTKSLNNPTPALHKKLFKLTVPRPLYVYPIYSDMVEVVPDYDPASVKNAFVHHATGLRFVYRWDAASVIELKIPSGSICNITPPVFKELPTLSDIEVRYQGIDLTDENDEHSDARACFASLATLVGSTCWLNYGDGKSCPTNPSPQPLNVGVAEDPCEGVGNGLEHPEVHTGGDCHAPVIADGLDV